MRENYSAEGILGRKKPILVVCVFCKTRPKGTSELTASIQFILKGLMGIVLVLTFLSYVTPRSPKLSLVSVAATCLHP